MPNLPSVTLSFTVDMKSFYRLFLFLLAMSWGIAAFAQSQHRAYREVVSLINQKDWHEAKRRINRFYREQPQQKSELDIVDAYEMGKLERRVDVAIEEEERTFSRFKARKDRKLAEEYLAEYPYGKYRDEVSTLLAQYDEEERAARLRQYREQEDAVIQTARNTGSVSAYESYLGTYPSGRYVAEANMALERGYVQLGNAAFARKDWYDARTEYQKYLSRFPRGGETAYVNAQLAKVNRKINQSGMDFFGFTHDATHTFGITYGGLQTDEVGLYLDVKANAHFFTYTLYTIDNAGDTDRPGYVIRTGETRQGAIAGTMGLTIPISYPLWLYAGAGVGYYPFYQEVDAYYSTGTYWETEWMRNTDITSIGFVAEAGLMIKLGDAVAVRGGAIRTPFGFGYQAGIVFE